MRSGHVLEIRPRKQLIISAQRNCHQRLASTGATKHIVCPRVGGLAVQLLEAIFSPPFPDVPGPFKPDLYDPPCSGAWSQGGELTQREVRRLLAAR